MWIGVKNFGVAGDSGISRTGEKDLQCVRNAFREQNGEARYEDDPETSAHQDKCANATIVSEVATMILLLKKQPVAPIRSVKLQPQSRSA